MQAAANETHKTIQNEFIGDIEQVNGSGQNCLVVVCSKWNTK